MSDAMLLPAALQEPALTLGVVTPGSLDDQVLSHADRRPPKAWFIAIAILIIGDIGSNN